MIQKKDKRLRKKDDVSHLSDDDTDPRQYERADEQATRSARVLYMIERQVPLGTTYALISSSFCCFLSWTSGSFCFAAFVMFASYSQLSLFG